MGCKLQATKRTSSTQSEELHGGYERLGVAGALAYAGTVMYMNSRT
ncbi:MAG: hypothetical protein JJP05_09340 [cyanobacterium endosymbiont of Rhopalodia gibba]